MAELIDKKVLIEEIKSLTVHVTGLRAGKGVLSKFMDEYRKSVLRTIDEQPTITEAEIRNKAIEKFEEQMKFKYQESLSNLKAILTTKTEIIDELLSRTEKNVENFVNVNGYLTGSDYRRILHETAEKLKGE